MPFYKWSTTAASNATADPSINWAEGQVPSSVNDSARAMMAAMAVARQDWHAVIGGGGTASAMTYTSQQGFTSLALMDTQLITFVCPATNAAGATLNVDGLGAIPICIDSSGTAVPAGVMVAGTPYMLTYYNGVSQFRLWNFFANPYSIPLGGGIDYWGASTPNSNFAFPSGQAISRTTYAALFALIGTGNGAGDGSTTFNLPDKRGRVSAGADNMNGSAAGRLTSASGMVSGTNTQAGGVETHTLTAAQIPTITSWNTGSIALGVTTSQKVLNGPNAGSAVAGGSQLTAADSGSGALLSLLTSTGTLNAADVNVTSNNTSGGAHNNVQPTICCNYIMRII